MATKGWRLTPCTLRMGSTMLMGIGHYVDVKVRLVAHHVGTKLNPVCAQHTTVLVGIT